MRKILAATVIFIVVTLFLITAVLISRRKQDPDVLLDWLRRGKGNKEVILMRLNMARGDVVASMLRAYHGKKASPEFKAEVLELMFKKQHRASDQRIEDFLPGVLKERDPALRRRIIECFATYAEECIQLWLLDHLDEPDSVNRHRIFSLFAENDKIWKLISEEQKEKLVKAAIREAARGKDSLTVNAARTVLGREIKILCDRALKACQSADLERGDSLFNSAAELDPVNPRSQIVQMRFYYNNGERQRALEIARKCGALFEIPSLPEAPVIEGDPGDQAWTRALRIDKFYTTWPRYSVLEGKTRAECYLGHHQGKIYIAVLVYEPEFDKLSTKIKDRDGPVWLDDNVEVIFDPPCEGKVLNKIIVNPIGAVMDQIKGDLGNNVKGEFRAGIFRDRGYWAVEFALHGRELEDRIAPGRAWGMNVFPFRKGSSWEGMSIP